MLLQPPDYRLGSRLLLSAARTDGPQPADSATIQSWLDDQARSNTCIVERIPFAELREWDFEGASGDLVHRSGGFFRVGGLRVAGGERPESWSQPIIQQPEVGILGLLVKQIDGVLCALVQAKVEPGNIRPVQLSPTVQATRSNFSRVHRGSATRYLEYFAEPGRARVLADVLQSEQGARFYHKWNRNMIVEVSGDEDVPVDDNFRWLSLGQLHALLKHDNLVNMDTRTVLSCLPWQGPVDADAVPAGDAFGRTVLTSLLGDRSLRSITEVQSWLSALRARNRMTARPTGLAEVTGWHRSEWRIAHQEGRHFEVIATSIVASAREVRAWCQPLVAPVGRGVVAVLVAEFDGVLHVLMRGRAEAGTLYGVELAPTVQCVPENYQGRPAPVFLQDVLRAAPNRIHFDTLLSEEGGRFHHAVNRYMIVEAGSAMCAAEPPEDFCWLTVGQLAQLVRHSGYLNVEARSLLACLCALW